MIYGLRFLTPGPSPEHPFRKLQAPSSRIVYSPHACFASFRPQTPELCTPPRGEPLPSSTRVPFSQASGPRLPNCVFPAWRTPPQQHAWGHPFRKLQAPNSRIVYAPGPPLFSAARVVVRFSQASGPKLPNCVVLPQNVLFSMLLGRGDWNRQEPRTDPQEPSEKPNRMNLNRLCKTATEPNRYIHGNDCDTFFLNRKACVRCSAYTARKACP